MYFVLGVGAWVALLESGVEPVVIGLAMGILPFAYPAERSNLERATERFREFREQPTAELARSAAAQLRTATPANERLQQLYHPWTSYGVVPLFALANAGIVINGDVLTRAFTSPITLGILFLAHELYFSRGLVMLHLGRIDQAAEDMITAVRFNPFLIDQIGGELRARVAAEAGLP